MGMFDTVVIEGLKLKTTPEVKKYLQQSSAEIPTDFQTKGLENALRTYKIDSKGQFWAHLAKETGKKIPYKNPFSHWTDNRSFLEKLYYKSKQSAFKAPKTVAEMKYVWTKQNTTNTFEIYTYSEIAGRYVDISYNVEVVSGKLKKIELRDSKIESISEAKARAQRNKEWENKMKQNFDARNKFVSQWYYPILKEIYNPTALLLRLSFQKLSSWLASASYRIRGI